MGDVNSGGGGGGGDPSLNLSESSDKNWLLCRPLRTVLPVDGAVLGVLDEILSLIF